MRMMNWILLGVLMLPAPSDAQGTRQTTGVPTPRASNSPFGSDWAKPFPQTGGYFYNDPRLQGANQPSRANRICPPGRRLSPYSGSCYGG